MQAQLFLANVSQQDGTKTLKDYFNHCSKPQLQMGYLLLSYLARELQLIWIITLTINQIVIGAF